MGKKKTGEAAAKAQAKKDAKKAEQAALQKQLSVATAARSLANPLESLPAPFLAFKKNGLDATVEFCKGMDLTADDRAAMHTVLDENMGPIYGQQEWDDEAAEDKQKELAEEDCRVLIIRQQSGPADAAQAAQGAQAERLAKLQTPPSTPIKDAASPPTASPDSPTSAPAEGVKVPQNILGFMHFRYEIEEDCLLLYIMELQIKQAQATRRKGLGKFFLLLAELMAKKAMFEGVMLTVQRVNTDAIAFYKGCKYTMDSISPAITDPFADEEDYNYEIFSKVWDTGARAKLDRGADEARKQWATEHDILNE